MEQCTQSGFCCLSIFHPARASGVFISLFKNKIIVLACVRACVPNSCGVELSTCTFTHCLLSCRVRLLFLQKYFCPVGILVFCVCVYVQT